MMANAFFKKLTNKKNRPYIIAEIGVNHECSMRKAKRLIDLAAEGGASAAKFQSYKAENLARRLACKAEPCVNWENKSAAVFNNKKFA